MNGNQTTNMSKELLQFCDNLKHDGKQNMLNHNLYEITSVDINGNVVDRKFGINLVTNRGMLFHYNGYSLHNRYYLSIGIGTGTPSVTDTTLFNKLDWSNTRSDTDQYITALKYDSLSGIISNTRQVLEVYYDYNITGVETPTNITEFGLTDSSGNLMTHSLIYDVNGNMTSIIKNINERLYFRVYRTINFKEDLINNAWDNGCYAIICNYDTDILDRYGRRYNCWVDYSRRNNDSSNPNNYIYASNVTSTPSPNGVVINEPVTISNVLQEYDKSIVSVTLGDNPKGYKNSRFRIVKRLRLQTPEEVTLPYLQTHYYASKSFEQMFGHIKKGGTGTGYYPITDYNMETLTTYNVETHEWDIPVPFSSPSNCDYCNYFDSPTRIYINFNGIRYMSVYLNINLNLPILALSGTTDPIYATDKYWDTSTYEIIPDVTNIPVGLRNKKYYITTANNVTLTPTTNSHEVIPHKESYNIGTFAGDVVFNYNGMGCSSEEHNWVIKNNLLLFITDSGIIRRVFPWYYSDTVPLFYTTGDILIYWYNSKFNTVDTTIPSTSSQTTDLILNFGTGVAVGTPMFTFTNIGSGYVVCQHLTLDKTVIIDLHGDTENNRPTQYLIENTKHCNAILCTKYCVYQRSDITGEHTFEIYDMETQTVIDTFSLNIDVSATTVLGIRAWSKFVYVRISSGSTYSTYLHRTDDNTTSLLSWDVGTNMNTSYISRPITHAVDECMVFQPSSNNTYNVGYGITSINDPTKLLVLKSDSEEYLYYRDILELKKVEFNGGTKILMSVKYDQRNQLSQRTIFDIGYFIDNPNDPINTMYVGNYYGRPMVYYKKGYIDLHPKDVLRWYPIEQLLMYRATGTTRSIQCMNNPKRISQSFNMKTTNDSSIWSIE